jgi:hypothetical protein
MQVNIYTDPDKIVKEIHASSGPNYQEKLTISEDITNLVINAYLAGSKGENLEIQKTGDSGALELIYNHKSNSQCVESSDLQEKHL